jgi:arsenate reductase (glutaredoxin)
VPFALYWIRKTGILSVGGETMALTFYWYPKCGTCRKAKKWLDSHDIPYNEVHIAENPPSKSELAELHRTSGLELKKFFNTSGQKYRELGLKDKLKNATNDEMLDLLASDGMLIKRPIAFDGNKVTVGFKEEYYQQNWQA